MYHCLFPLVLFQLLLGLTTNLYAANGETEGGAGGGAGDNEPKWIINDGTALNLPAGSMISIALALDRGAEAVALGLVLSKDNQIVVLADARIEEITNVAATYPDRARADGSYYSFDFTLDELKHLSYRHDLSTESVDNTAVATLQFPVISLNDVLGYIDLVFADPAPKPTLICVLKKGWLHQQEDKELGTTVVAALENYRATSAKAKLFLASFDPEELQRLAENRAAQHVDNIGFIQLIGSNDGAEVMRLEFGQYQPYNYDLLFTRFGLKAVSAYAAVIGLLPQTIVDEYGTVLKPHYLDDARTLGVKVICYGADSAHLANSVVAGTQEDLFEHLLFSIGFDGIVTANDGPARDWLASRSASSGGDEQITIEHLIEQIEDSGIEPTVPYQSDITR